MDWETEMVALRGRMAALEFVTVMQTLLSASEEPGFNPKDFAERRRAFWAEMGATLNDDGSAGGGAMQKALESLGKLLTVMAEPLHNHLEDV